MEVSDSARSASETPGAATCIESVYTRASYEQRHAFNIASRAVNELMEGAIDGEEDAGYETYSSMLSTPQPEDDVREARGDADDTIRREYLLGSHSGLCLEVLLTPSRCAVALVPEPQGTEALPVADLSHYLPLEAVTAPRMVPGSAVETETWMTQSSKTLEAGIASRVVPGSAVETETWMTQSSKTLEQGSAPRVRPGSAVDTESWMTPLDLPASKDGGAPFWSEDAQWELSKGLPVIPGSPVESPVDAEMWLSHSDTEDNGVEFPLLPGPGGKDQTESSGEPQAVRDSALDSEGSILQLKPGFIVEEISQLAARSDCNDELTESCAGPRVIPGSAVDTESWMSQSGASSSRHMPVMSSVRTEASLEERLLWEVSHDLGPASFLGDRSSSQSAVDKPLTSSFVTESVHGESSDSCAEKWSGPRLEL